MTVSAAATGPLSTRSVITAVDVLDSNIIQRQKVDYTWELFRRVPGAMLTRMSRGMALVPLDSYRWAA